MLSGAGLQSTGTDKTFRRWVTPISVSLGLVAITTALLWLVEARLQQQHLIFIYLVPTALIAIRYGSISAMGVMLACGFAAAYFLYPPRLSFLIDSPLDLMELGLFGLLALLACQVVAGFANDRNVQKRRGQVGVPLRRRWSAIASLWNRARST
jgi:K+-sensing histidine kinase KdpD